jgi:hypothetical protein
MHITDAIPHWASADADPSRVGDTATAAIRVIVNASTPRIILGADGSAVSDLALRSPRLSGLSENESGVSQNWSQVTNFRPRDSCCQPYRTHSPHSQDMNSKHKSAIVSRLYKCFFTPSVPYGLK